MSLEEKYRKEVVEIIQGLATINDSEEEENIRKLIRKARIIKRKNKFFNELQQTVQSE